MKIITGFRHLWTPEWNKAMEVLAQSAQKNGCQIFIYDLPTQDIWLASKYHLLLSLCWKYKVIFLSELLDKIKEDILWIDGDCIVNKPIDFKKAIGEADIAFTLRDIEDRRKTIHPERDGLINSGVIFIRNNDKARDFFKESLSLLSDSLYDQEAFNSVILKYSPMENYDYINAGGITIRLLNCREYNNFYDDETFDKAIIEHFKGSLRDKYRDRFGITL